jgi:hypothetical protein
MLKAKASPSTNRNLEAVRREVLKVDNDNAIHVRITSKEKKKLRIELANREMSIVEWVKEKIGEIK